MCGAGPEGGPLKEGPAAASVVPATGEHEECFWGSRSSYIPESNAFIPSDYTPFPLYSICQSLKNNDVPGIFVLTAAAGVKNRPLDSTNPSSSASATYCACCGVTYYPDEPNSFKTAQQRLCVLRYSSKDVQDILSSVGGHRDPRYPELLLGLLQSQEDILYACSPDA